MLKFDEARISDCNLRIPQRRQFFKILLLYDINVDRSTNFFGGKEKNKKINPERLLFLRLYESFHKCTSPPVKHLPSVDHRHSKCLNHHNQQLCNFFDWCKFGAPNIHCFVIIFFSFFSSHFYTLLCKNSSKWRGKVFFDFNSVFTMYFSSILWKFCILVSYL